MPLGPSSFLKRVPGLLTWGTLGKLREPEGVAESIREPWVTYPP